MDTKLKSYDKKKILRGVLFCLCVLTLLLGSFFSVMGLARIDATGISDYRDVAAAPDYENSYTFQDDIHDIMDRIIRTMILGQMLSAGKEGQPVNGYVLRDWGFMDVYGGYESYYDEAGRYEEPEKFVTLDQDDIQILESRYENYREDLNEIQGLFYYGKLGDFTMATEGFSTESSLIEAKRTAESNPAWYVYEKGSSDKYPDISERRYETSYILYEDYSAAMEASQYELVQGSQGDGPVVYLGFDRAFLDKGNLLLKSQQNGIMAPVVGGIVLLVASLILLAACMVFTGKWDEEGKPVLNIGDKIWTEAQLLIVCLCFFLGGTFFLISLFEGCQYFISSELPGDMQTTTSLWGILVSVLIGIPSAVLGIEMILALVRSLKYRRFVKNALLYKCYSPFKEMILGFLKGGTVMKRILTVAAVLCAFTALLVFLAICFTGDIYEPVGALFLTALLVFLALGIGSRFILPHVRQYEEIRKGVEAVKGGDLSYQIPVEADTELGRLASDINHISEGFDIAVQNEMKSQRMKTDLISNVSHDIKTPLTSIITYVDLLKREGLDCERAEEYLDILQQKSFRLKKLTEDLFDAAKASSGAVTVSLEEVELLALLNQGLGEMSEGIEETGLVFKINASREHYYVVADGQLLWRVWENLLSNILKYAQERTRVYVDVLQDEEQVRMVVKNISKTELNMEADELMERFKRGDESRSTEGSGLGLAIARDLVKAQNGSFSIQIDGDLFKATVILQRARRGKAQDEKES